MEMIGGLLSALSLMQASTQHREQLLQSGYLHRDQRILDKLLAQREESRDIWEQKNQKTQTLLIVNTLMFGSAFSLISQGQLPENIPEFLFIAYSTTMALSFMFLLYSVWFAMCVQSRTTNWNSANRDQFYKLRNRDMEQARYANFQDYYKEHCRHLSVLAEKSFYIGTVMLISAAAILISSQMTYKYQTRTSSYVFAALCGLTVLILLTLPLQYPSDTRGSRRAQASQDVTETALKSGTSTASAGMGLQVTSSTHESAVAVQDSGEDSEDSDDVAAPEDDLERGTVRPTKREVEVTQTELEALHTAVLERHRINITAETEGSSAEIFRHQHENQRRPTLIVAAPQPQRHRVQPIRAHSRQKK